MTSRPGDAAATQTLRRAEALLAAPVLRWLDGATRPWLTDPWTSFEGLLRASLGVEPSIAPSEPVQQQRDAPNAWAWASARPAPAAPRAGPDADHARPAAQPLAAPAVSLPGAGPTPTLPMQTGQRPNPHGDALRGDERVAAKPRAQDARVDADRPSPRPPLNAPLSPVPTRAQRLASAALLRRPVPVAQVWEPEPDLAPPRPASARILAWPTPGYARHRLASAAAPGDSAIEAAPPVRGQAGAAAGARTRLVSGLPALHGLLQQALADRPAVSWHAAPARVQPPSLAVRPALATATADGPAEAQHLPFAPAAAPGPAVAAPLGPQALPLLEAVGEDVLVDRLIDRLEERLREHALRQFGRSGGLV